MTQHLLSNKIFSVLFLLKEKVPKSSRTNDIQHVRSFALIDPQHYCGFNCAALMINSMVLTCCAACFLIVYVHVVKVVQLKLQVINQAILNNKDSSMSVVCKNCNHEFSKNYKYCPYCGQAATTERLNFHHLTHDIVHAFIHADKGVFLLFKELSYMPGKVARLYVEGKRKKYFNPFSFLVLMVAIALIFILKFESLVVSHRNLNAGNLEFLHFVFKYFNVFIFIMCPVNAFLTWLFFRKYK